MGKTFKNHTEFMKLKEKEKRDSDFAEKLVRQVEMEFFHEYLGENTILKDVGILIL